MKNDTSRQAAPFAKNIRQKKRRLTFVISAIALFAFLIFLLAYLPRIHHVQLEGVTRIAVSDFLNMTGIHYGEHILSLKEERIREQLASNPYYMLETSEYIFPDTLKITLVERSNDACLRFLDQDIVISRDSTVLDMGASGSFPDMLRLQGISVTGYQIGEPLGVQDDYQLETTKVLLALLYESDYRTDYEIVDISNPLDIKLLSRNRITVRLGQLEDIDTKLFRSARILRQLAAEGVVGGIVDASTNLLSYRDADASEIIIPDEGYYDDEDTETWDEAQEGDDSGLFAGEEEVFTSQDETTAPTEPHDNVAPPVSTTENTTQQQPQQPTQDNASDALLPEEGEDMTDNAQDTYAGPPEEGYDTLPDIEEE